MSTEYARRVIEEIRAALKGMVLKDRNDPAKTASDLDAKCVEVVGADLRHVLASSPQGLREFLNTGGWLAPGRSMALAEILLCDASMSEERGDFERAALDYVHASYLIADNLMTLDETEKETYRLKLDLLLNRIEALRKDPRVGDILQRYDRFR